MPKGNTNEDRAKVKFRVIEFELEGGNANVENSIRQLAHAFTNHTNGGSARVPPPGTPRELAAPPPATEDTESTVQDADFTEVEEATPEPSPPRPTRQRTPHKPPNPNYLAELDSTMAFKAFAAAKPQAKHSKRYLLATLWLRDNKQLQSVGIDHIYTCYRNAGWPMNISDWDSNFRSLLKSDRFRRIGPGNYAITPKGEDDVRKLNDTE
jgi:hypothetical protein